ncbi:MAG: hypothetical protein PHU53_07160 [Thermoplasmata archaeon]|nr:hypothetical protein [Thermoplasmata archaeon]
MVPDEDGSTGDFFDRYTEEQRIFKMKLSRTAIAAIFIVFFYGVVTISISNQMASDYADVNGDLPGAVLMGSTLCFEGILIASIVWIGIIVLSIAKESKEIAEFSHIGTFFVYSLFLISMIQDYRAQSPVAYSSGLPWYIYSYFLMTIVFLVSLGFISSYVRKLQVPSMEQDTSSVPDR